ncbi:MAG: hypothetical protein A2133_08540 [Actinobacteria bacterium RBG_16_64_13]|nr:MAG: hypothetical protein A2133_08540 [Actinobacteria bacterium RBG_16_64_13]
MARLVRTVQPYCAENIVAAMPCSRGHADSTGSSLFAARKKEQASGLRSGGGLGALPEDVFLALGSRWIYAFDYTPKLVGFEIKERVACWPKDEVSVLAEYTSTMVYFVIRTRSGESHALEVSAMSAPAGRPAVEFLHLLGAVDYRATLE